MDDNYNTRKLPLINAPGKYALVDDDYDGEWMGYLTWRLHPNGFAQNTTLRDRSRGQSQQARYLHRMAYGESLIPKGWWVTNVNGNRLDCRTRNLVCLSPAMVIQSRRAQSARKTLRTRSKNGYRGVAAAYNTIYAIVRGVYVRNPDGTIKNFASLEEAARAYDELAKATWGDNAVLNFPPGGRKESVMPEAHYSPVDKAKGITSNERRELGVHLEALAALMANAFGGSLADLEKEDLDAIKRTQKAIEAMMERRQ